MSVLRSRCAVCGWPVESRSARREGKDWFCSQSCLLQYESAGGRSGGRRAPSRGAVGVVRKAVRWTLGVVGGFVLVAIVVGIVDATKGQKPKTADAGTANKAKVRLAAGGLRSNPVPLHTIGGVWDGWRLHVESVTPTAAQFLGRHRKSIAPGGREFMLSISVTYKAGGYKGVRGLLRRLYVAGSHAVYYSPDSGDLNCAATAYDSHLVRPLNETARIVFSGHTAEGHLCFQIASNDARSLVLFVNRPGCGTSKKYDTCTKKVWFALG
ncbi:MAG TPA: hypothetical protein VIM33_01605 [Gaiellaceae bacterium]|jgi:hypothetical protein